MFYLSILHRPELKPVEKEIEVTLKFPDVEPLNPPVLTLNEIAFKYNQDKVIFNCVNLCGNLDSRICIVGENGAGKTTLLKIIMGMLSPTGGTMSQHRGLKFGYFAQHHVDQLNMNTTCVGLLQEVIIFFLSYLGDLFISVTIELHKFYFILFTIGISRPTY